MSLVAFSWDVILVGLVDRLDDRGLANREEGLGSTSRLVAGNSTTMLKSYYPTSAAQVSRRLGEEYGDDVRSWGMQVVFAKACKCGKYHRSQNFQRAVTSAVPASGGNLQRSLKKSPAAFLEASRNTQQPQLGWEPAKSPKGPAPMAAALEKRGDRA